MLVEEGCELVVEEPCVEYEEIPGLGVWLFLGIHSQLIFFSDLSPVERMALDKYLKGD